MASYDVENNIWPALPATAANTSLSGDASCAPYTEVTLAVAAAAPG